MKNSRQYNASLNILAIYTSKIFQILLAFFVRRILIINLGEEILGIDGLFASVLSVLNLADLGVNTAIIYALYTPLVKQDEKKIAALMSFFKKAYTIVGFCIFIIGLSFLPFLQVIINLDNELQDVKLYYILTIIATSVSYFCSSRRVIFEADQMSRVIVVIDTLANFVRQLGQLLIIWLFSDYVIVLFFRIFMSIVDNLVIYYIGNKKYPYLYTYKNEKLSLEEKKNVLMNTGAIFCHKFGGVIVNSTDAIIISSFISTVISGYYSNYMILINSITFFVTSIFTAIIPSIGNLKAESSDMIKQYKLLEETILLNYILSCFCTSCLFALLNPFITIWIGEKFIFNMEFIVLLCINFYLTTIRYGVGAFCTAGGIFRDTILKPILESVVNLIVSVALVKIIGLNGVIIGTIISLICGSLWVDPYFLLKKWFGVPIANYFGKFVFMFLLTVMISFITYYVSSFIQVTNISSFFIKALIVVFISLLATTASAKIFPEFKYIFWRIRRIGFV